MNTERVFVEPFPASVPASEGAILRTRLDHALADFSERTGLNDLQIRASFRNGKAVPSSTTRTNGEPDTTKFDAKLPKYQWDRVCLPEATCELILTALATIQHEYKLFEEWGLAEIQPHPRQVLNLHGPAGTGKTLAAHGIASYLGKSILVATYADLESMYLGAGPKNVAAFFQAAREQDALAFIDEADSLLGRRMAVTQGSERAANSMTSQLLLELEQHSGIVVFATNLLDNYDSAFQSRVLQIHVPLPDKALRLEIWKKHLPKKLPLRDLDLVALSEIDGICGRDVRNAVLLAANRAALSARDYVTHDDLVTAIGVVHQQRVHPTL